MKTGGFKSTSFAGSTSRRDFRRSFPPSLINIFRGNLERLPDALTLLERERDRSSRSRCTRLSVSSHFTIPKSLGVGELKRSSQLLWMQFVAFARLEWGARFTYIRIFVYEFAKRSQPPLICRCDAKTWISLLSSSRCRLN